MSEFDRERVDVYRVEVLIVDHDGVGAAGIKAVLEEARYPNRCISPQVVRVDGRTTMWDDGHVLNRAELGSAEFDAWWAASS